MFKVPLEKRYWKLNPRNTSLADVKQLIEGKLHIPSDTQDVYFNQVKIEADPSTCLANLGIQFKNTLVVCPSSQEPPVVEMSDWQDSLTYEPKRKSKRFSLQGFLSTPKTSKAKKAYNKL